jgi:4'-phosphopantetheinyl transferase
MPEPLIWCSPLEKLELPESELHVWRADLTLASKVLDRLALTLDNDEKARAARFHFARDRDHFTVCRGILRELLGEYLGSSPASIEFTYGVYGKPAHRPGDSRPPIRFNVSHSCGHAVLAFARNCEIGIDLEPISPEFAGEEIAKRYFSAREVEELLLLPAEMRPEGFSLCWTRKEAYVKARGLGLQIPLDSFSVSLTPNRPERLESADSQRWRLRSFTPAPNFAAAVVHEKVSEGVQGRDNFQLRYWDWVVPVSTPLPRALGT